MQKKKKIIIFLIVLFPILSIIGASILYTYFWGFNFQYNKKYIPNYSPEMEEKNIENIIYYGYIIFSISIEIFLLIKGIKYTVIKQEPNT